MIIFLSINPHENIMAWERYQKEKAKKLGLDFSLIEVNKDDAIAVAKASVTERKEK